MKPIKLSNQSQQELWKTLVAYFINDGESKQEAHQAADSILDDVLLYNCFSFELWDALGCDDEGLVKANPQLQGLYKKIEIAWQESQNYIKN